MRKYVKVSVAFLMFLFVFNLNFTPFLSEKISVCYDTLPEGQAWRSELSDIETAITHIKNLEAVRIRLVDRMAKDHNIFYRTYVQNYGWLGWARNGEIAGSIDANLKIKNIQIKVVKNDTIPNLEKSSTFAPLVFNTAKQSIREIFSRSKTLKLCDKRNNETFFKCPEHRVYNSKNGEVWSKMLNIKESEDSKLRNVAASRIADLLNPSNIIVKSQSAIICSKGINIQGALMQNAGGMDFFPFKALGNKTISPSLQRSLSNLEIFDGLIAQIDRCPWNYSIITSKRTKRAVSVVGYDNDLTFGNVTNLKGFSYWGSPIITSDNKIALQYADRTLIDSILNISDNQVRAALFDTLDSTYINATICRLNQLKDAISNTCKDNPHFLLNENEWSQKTINDELNCPYYTYLKLFADRMK